MIEIIVTIIVFLIGLAIAYWIGYKTGAFRKNKYISKYNNS